MTYRVKDWTKFQHFKDRRPPWIKLYRDILDNRDIAMISDRCFRVLIGCWLLASEDKTREGLLPCAEDIAFRLRIEKTSVIECLDALCDFVYQDDINQASPCQQVGPSETETEKRQREREIARSNLKIKDHIVVSESEHQAITGHKPDIAPPDPRIEEHLQATIRESRKVDGPVILDEMATKFDMESYREVPRCEIPPERVIARMSTNPRPDQSDPLPLKSPEANTRSEESKLEYDPRLSEKMASGEVGLKSPEANAVWARIREYWPDYDDILCRETAAKLYSAYGQKIDVLDVIDAAWAGWDPKRTVNDKSGLHVYLASYCNTEAGKAPRASETPSRGNKGVPHQAEASRPPLRIRLERLEQAIKEGRQIDPHAMVDTWNEAILDQYNLDPFNNIRWLIPDLSKRGFVEFGKDGKILDHSLPDEPRTPKELLKGDEAPDPEFVKQQIAQLTAMKGLEE